MLSCTAPTRLTVLPQDLRSSFREVQGETSLIGTEVVDVEDQFLRKVFWRTPHCPANTGIDLRNQYLKDKPKRMSAYQSVLVPRNIDRNDLLKTEIPLKIRSDERSDETSRCSVDMDRAVNTLRDKEVIDFLCVLVFASVCCAPRYTFNESNASS